jgi:hypothetical protein
MQIRGMQADLKREMDVLARAIKVRSLCVNLCVYVCVYVYVRDRVRECVWRDSVCACVAGVSVRCIGDVMSASEGFMCVALGTDWIYFDLSCPGVG